MFNANQIEISDFFSHLFVEMKRVEMENCRNE